MERLVTHELSDGVKIGRERLVANPRSARRAVLVVDGYITLESGKTDALIVELKDHQDDSRSFSMAVPYRGPGLPGGFAVFRPEFMSFPGAAGAAAYDDTVQAFCDGVDEDTEGSRVWNEHIDQSR